MYLVFGILYELKYFISACLNAKHYTLNTKHKKKEIFCEQKIVLHAIGPQSAKAAK